MPRLSPVDPATATGKAKRILTQARRHPGYGSNAVLTIARSPVALNGYLDLYRALNDGRLDPRLRELIALAVAEANTSSYCVRIHTAIARGLGLPLDAIRAARDGRSADRKVQAALCFARRVVEYRGDVTDEEFACVRKAGYDDEDIAEILANVVLNIFTNYFNVIAQTEIDVPESW